MSGWPVVHGGAAWQVIAVASSGLAVLLAHAGSDRRLASLDLPGSHRPPAPASTVGTPDRAGPRPWNGPVLVLSVLVLEPLLVAGPAGLAMALPAAAVAHWFWQRAVAQQASVTAKAVRRELPLLLDLLAAALRSGATTDVALTLAADAVGAPADGLLREVVAGLRLGASIAEAWAPVGPTTGLHALARVAVRSGESGAAMAGACSELARRERARRHLEAQAAVKRAGVWAVLPLALCYLPAFVLVGVVLLVVGLLQSLAV